VVASVKNVGLNLMEMAQLPILEVVQHVVGVVRDQDENYLSGLSSNFGACSITVAELWAIDFGFKRSRV